MQGSLSMPDSEVNQNSYTGLTVTLSFDLLSVDTQRHILSSLVVQRRNTAMNKATCSSIKWILTHSRPAQNMNRTLRSVNCEFRLRSDLEREREKEIERGEEERLAGWIFRDFMTTLWAVVSYFFSAASDCTCDEGWYSSSNEQRILLSLALALSSTPKTIIPLIYISCLCFCCFDVHKSMRCLGDALGRWLLVSHEKLNV